jgi:hypothetical protein
MRKAELASVSIKVLVRFTLRPMIIGYRAHLVPSFGQGAAPPPRMKPAQTL